MRALPRERRRDRAVALPVQDLDRPLGGVGARDDDLDDAAAAPATCGAGRSPRC